MYIPIGKNCLVAGQLNILKLREVSLPFDWLLIKDQYIFTYLNDLINTKFENFTKNLLYNDRNVVISEKYPFCEFLHQNLINNTIKNKPPLDYNLKNAIDRRCNRFMELIENKDNKNLFICNISYNSFKLYESLFFNEINKFINNKNIKCKFYLLIILSFKKDFYMEIDNKFKELKMVSFEKLLISQENTNTNNMENIYGNKNDFLKILKKYDNINS